MISNEERAAIFYVIETGNGINVACQDYNDVHAMAMRFNRWKKKMSENMPDLDKVRVCKRFDPPRINLKYDNTYDVELTDSEGNPLGFSLNDLAIQRAEQHRQELEQKAEEQAGNMREAEKRRINRGLASIGFPVDEEEDGLTDAQRTAIDEFIKQNEREPNETERHHLLRSVADDDIGMDI